LKPFLHWLAVAAISFGTLGFGYHTYLEANPFRVAVIVDSSHPMQPRWGKVLARLDDLDDRRYTAFSLFSEKKKVHGWRTTLRPGDLVPYAPRDFSKLSTMSEIDQAEEVIFLTNASEDDIDAYDDWTILRVD